MSSMPETLLNLFLNPLLQVSLFAIVAAAFSRLVAKAKASHQHFFYLTALLFSLANVQQKAVKEKKGS